MTLDLMNTVVTNRRIKQFRNKFIFFEIIYGEWLVFRGILDAIKTQRFDYNGVERSR